MKSVDLLLSGIMGSSVRCIKPIRFLGVDDCDIYAVSNGDTGRVVGLVDMGAELEILVSMDNEKHDYQSFMFKAFASHFEVDTSQRKFRRVL
jgi:hypothetical protein